jgi:hypothetical protein
MLLNPCKVHLPVITGTRILQNDLGLAGFQYQDPANPGRVWTLQYLFAPIPRRALGGIRAKLMDDKGFVTFCNQRDLEILLGVAKPGELCYWLGQDYPEIGEKDWYGLCVDEEDLKDDLHERELRLREQCPGILPSHIEITRRIHDGGADAEELNLLLWDMDMNTGLGPDTRLETVDRRWVRIERTPVKWKYTDL